VTLPPGASLSAAFSLAARPLAGQPPAFEFLPPKPTLWQQVTTKYASGKLRSAGAVAAGVLLIVGGMFAYQQIQLVRYRSQWSRIAAQVKELETVQEQIRQYRPWFDESFRSLSILKQVTTAFPETGDVTAKTIEIRDGSVVSCSGNARDQAAFLKTFSQLQSATNAVSQLKVQTIRGKMPMQFTFDFHWTAGGPL